MLSCSNHLLVCVKLQRAVLMALCEPQQAVNGHPAAAGKIFKSLGDYSHYTKLLHLKTTRLEACKHPAYDIFLL